VDNGCPTQNKPGIVYFTNPPKMRKTNRNQGEIGVFGFSVKNIRLYAFLAFGDALVTWPNAVKALLHTPPPKSKKTKK
jgi:hypothetical protein